MSVAVPSEVQALRWLGRCYQQASRSCIWQSVSCKYKLLSLYGVLNLSLVKVCITLEINHIAGILGGGDHVVRSPAKIICQPSW